MLSAYRTAVGDQFALPKYICYHVTSHRIIIMNDNSAEELSKGDTDPPLFLACALYRQAATSR